MAAAAVSSKECVNLGQLPDEVLKILTDRLSTLTDEEKAEIRAWLGL